jgi:hypothetical protein
MRDGPIPGTMTLNEGILLLLAVYALSVGVYGILAPGRAFRTGYRWSDRWTRWLTLGLLKKGLGPIMSDEMAERIAFVGGWIVAGGGLLLLMAVLVQAWS